MRFVDGRGIRLLRAALSLPFYPVRFALYQLRPRDMSTDGFPPYGYVGSGAFF